MRKRIGALWLVVASIMASGPVGAGEGAEARKVNFAREILPILSEKCFVCHGPDARKKDALRLDSFEAATQDRGGYKAIDPQTPEKSALLSRIHDAEDPMPPKDAEKQLTTPERELLSSWIRQGGGYTKHWAFVPPRKQDKSHSIDEFVLARLSAKGWAPAPEADRNTLARRAALVLTGLPPEPEQLQRYLKDRDEGAYERLVDELLASPRYGEHQARYWLDAVRYGDTHGLHLDNRRGIYPYRDWVVRAFNGNLPLDQFITWQLAGDLLAAPTLAQRIATGYVRMNPTTAEGGVLPEEFQAKNNFDRTETLGTVFLGMSLNCARCHTHKYDPIPQKEYYQLLAFFNSTAEFALDGNAYTYEPVAKAPDDQTAWDEWLELESERETLLDTARSEIEARLPEIRSHAEARRQWKTENWRVSEVVDASKPPPDEKVWKETKDFPGMRRSNLPGSDKAIWVSFKMQAPADQSLWLTYSGGPGSEVWIDGIAVPPDVEPWPDQRTSRIELPFSQGGHQVRVKMVGPNTGTPTEIRLEHPWDELADGRDWATCDRQQRLLMLADPRGPLGHLLQQKHARGLALRMFHFESDFTTTLVARELDERRETRLLRRGEYNLPTGEPLEPGVLNVMGAFPKDAPRNRLGLARWLTSPDHPLVARVLINRVWQRVFGEGLVRTPEDFGLQGQQPTHPELLDWLAVELHECGWDLKRMLRLMVTSRTFRQSSARRDDVDDPENRMLARGPSFRLDAEVLRDLALWASGLLDPKMGGEGVKPYQPNGLWLAMAHPASNTKRYVRDTGRRLYRRSLYVYWKRTSPHPMMTLFDAPSRETSCVRRSRTNTSLQSLGLLNETQRLELSRALAERLLNEGSDDTNRLNRLFGLLACREPNAAERAACGDLLEKMRARYSEDREGALALLSTGEAPRDEHLNPAEHAAWTQVAVTVLASDIALLLY